MTLQTISCRNMKVTMHDPRGSVWCQPCVHYTIPNHDGLCTCCLAKLPKIRSKISELDKFDRILEANKIAITSYQKEPCRRELEFGWPVRIGIINYFVPARYLAEYNLLLQSTAGEDSYRRFLESVKAQCTVLSRGMIAVK